MTDEARETRIRNYAIKRANGFRCAVGGCEADCGIVVVAYGDNQTTACLAKHAAEADYVVPFQFPQSAQHEAELAKQQPPARRRR